MLSLHVRSWSNNSLALGWDFGCIFVPCLNEQDTKQEPKSTMLLDGHVTFATIMPGVHSVISGFVSTGLLVKRRQLSLGLSLS